LIIDISRNLKQWFSSYSTVNFILSYLIIKCVYNVKNYINWNNHKYVINIYNRQRQLREFKTFSSKSTITIGNNRQKGAQAYHEPPLNVKYVDVNINFITFTNSGLRYCGLFYVVLSFYNAVYCQF